MTAKLATTTPLGADRTAVWSFEIVYADHVAFVWRVLRALGVQPAQLEDAAQDVFVVVHRRLAEFEGRSAITTWLFAITRRVAARHRQRAAPAQPYVAEAFADADPFADAARAEAASTIAAILDRMDPDQRIVFVLVELEQVSVAETARMLDLNPNTAHSRLRLARAEFAAGARRARSAP